MKLGDLKVLLLEEPYEVVGYRQQAVRPILHNKDLIILQFQGWAINLKADGTFNFESTDGG